MEVFDIIAYLGGWAVLTVGIAIFIGRFLAERIADKMKLKWSREQEEKLELLRAEINHEHSIFTAILNSYSSSHQFSQSNRVNDPRIECGGMSRQDQISFDKRR